MQRVPAVWQRRLLLLILAGISACAGIPQNRSDSALPDWAAPRVTEVENPEVLDASAFIAYRMLTRSDFRGQHPVPELSAYADRLGAITCAFIQTSLGGIWVEFREPSDGERVYRATPQGLRFEALMDPDCSWWNPGDLGLPASYVLRHEQIHFAIFELEVRKMNARIPELEARFTATAGTQEAAIELLQQQLEEAHTLFNERVLVRSRAFDEDTSMGHRPKAQALWWSRINAELSSTPD